MKRKEFDICIVAAGQPATNPRTVKEAQVLSNRGYSVCVVYAFSIGWADELDESIINSDPAIHWKLVAGHPVKSPVWFYLNSILYKGFKLSSKAVRQHTKYTFNRSSWALCEVAGRIRARLYIGHNLASLPAVALAAKRNGGSYSFDAEDYHRGQVPGYSKMVKDTILIEDRYLPGATYISAASPMIADKYKASYPGLRVKLINNVFSIRHISTGFAPYNTGDFLRLFWFSQTVSGGRGIEDVIAALGVVKNPCVKFTIVGNCSSLERKRLEDLAGEQRSQISFVNPVSEDELFRLASLQHIGLALEGDGTLNRDICLTNKIFAYLLAGLAIVATETSAQKRFIDAFPTCGKTYKPGNFSDLAALIESYFNSPEMLNEARQASREFAKHSFNWEHEQEQFLELVKPVVTPH